MTELLSSRTLDLYSPIRDEEMRLFVQRIHEQAIVGATVDVGAELSRFVKSFLMHPKFLALDQGICLRKSTIIEDTG